jgi:hypothetical protein
MWLCTFHLAIAFLLAATAIFVRTLYLPSGNRLWMLGCIAIFLGVLSSWEAALAPIGLIAASWMFSDCRGVKRGLAYFIAGAITACGILSWYFWQCP